MQLYNEFLKCVRKDYVSFLYVPTKIEIVYFLCLHMQNFKVLWGCSICKSRCCASWGLSVAKNAGLASLIIETASQMVADLISNRKGSKKEIYWVISEIQDKD